MSPDHNPNSQIFYILKDDFYMILLFTRTRDLNIIRPPPVVRENSRLFLIEQLKFLKRKLATDAGVVGRKVLQAVARVRTGPHP